MSNATNEQLHKGIITAMSIKKNQTDVVLTLIHKDDNGLPSSSEHISVNPEFWDTPIAHEFRADLSEQNAINNDFLIGYIIGSAFIKHNIADIISLLIKAMDGDSFYIYEIGVENDYWQEKDADNLQNWVESMTATDILTLYKQYS